MFNATLEKPTRSEAWIIDSAAFMGKDVEAIFAFGFSREP